ncbi:carbon storage regulator CsrA [Paenibacillus sp. 2RAB27]|jgi:carbon storage regulator|uniref:carbon storage regulator CsrA n=1 Tax=unclassified Paenibacillus TaxID=185978 RepID=UPI0007004711|nr:carbon storage regulator CsrA [Paenibacillus sp. Soil750]KRE73590.1 carbon storage regulator [Paenibacillus sp. Soil750]
MLVLTRKKGEAIMIGDHIELIVLGTEGDTVRLGISAPKSVEVFRKEIYLSIQQANKDALGSASNYNGLNEMFKKTRKTE